MAWADDDYRQRAILTIVPTATAATDLTFTVPTTWDDFWDVIDADGYGIRVYSPQGAAISYQVSSFTLATRTMVIELDAQSLVDGTLKVYHLYFDIDSPTNGASTLTITSASSLQIYLGDPTWGEVLDAVKDPPGATEPTQRISIIDEADMEIVWRIPLRPSASPLNGRFFYDEIYRVYQDTSGHYAASTPTTPPSDIWLCERDDVLYCIYLLPLSSSTVGTDTVRLDFSTLSPAGKEQRQIVRALLDIIDLEEA